MQKYKEINGNDYVKNSRTTINETMQSIQSMNSGTAFPTNNLFEGMKCYRTDLKKTYTLTDVENNTWVEDAHATLSDEATHAASATKLQTARSLNLGGAVTADAATFDGTANATINVKTLDATKLKGTASVSTTGNAATATKLSTARKINITGNASGSAAFDGSGDISISTTVNESKHAANADTATKLADESGNNHISINSTTDSWSVIGSNPGNWLKSIRTDVSAPPYSIGNFSAAVAFGEYDTKGIITHAYDGPFVKFAGGNGSTAGWKFTIHGGSDNETYDLNNFPTKTGGGASGTWGISISGNAASATKATSATTAAACSGNSATATKLATPRAISLTGNASGSANFDGSGNVSINTTVNESKHAAAATALDIYAYRPADANIQKGDGLVRRFLATSEMSKNKPPEGDGHILSFAWDNNGGYDAQLFVGSKTGRINVRGQDAGKWSDWLTVLDSANFNSYAPTKTGGGASGTWGISITGNASTATKIVNNGDRNDLANGTKPPSGLSVYRCYTHAGYPQQYGNVISIGGTGDNELFLGWADDSRLLYRAKRDNKSNWESWRAIAFTDEINNYAPTKTGGGASGTWGINISGNAASATNADKLDGYHASDLLGKIYPVGSIYMSMSATNPHDLFGVGTWKRISQGRMLLGADDSTYKAGATGGEATHTLTAAEMPAHSHDISTSGNHSHYFYGSDDNNGPLTEGDGLDTEGNAHRTHNDRFTTSSAGAHTHTISNSGGGAAHNNMSPYLVCYIWQRTA